MKFLAAATLATGATAAVTVRDVGDIQKVLKNVGTKISALTSTIESYKGGSIADQLTAGKALDSAINDGKTQIGTDTLGIQDAFSLSVPVASLASLATPLVSALSVKRATVESAGSCSEVASLVDAVYNDGNALVSSVIALVQADARQIASQLASPLQAALASASSDYAGCKNAAGGSKPTSSAAGSSSAAETSAAETSAAETSAAETSAAVTTPTGAATPTSSAGGAVTTPGTGVVPTAAAAIYAPAGALALAAAVLAL